MGKASFSIRQSNMAGVMNKTEAPLLKLEHLLKPEFVQPPPGLEMFGPGSIVSMQEARDTYIQDFDKDASKSECSTAEAWKVDECSSLASNDYCPGDVLKMSAQLSSG